MKTKLKALENAKDPPNGLHSLSHGVNNRTSTKAGGDQTGWNLRSATYGANNVNQYTNRTVPGAVDLIGIANVGASVSISGDTNVYRRGEYFRKELAVMNTSAAQWVSNSIVATLSTNSVGTTGSVFVAQSPEPFTYDLDGNLRTDGRWTYTWDAENRLTGMLCLTNAPPNSKRWLQFAYDWQGRRILKTACVWTNGAWSLVLSNHFLYDDWNLVAELNATNNNAIRSYLWGADLSGTAQGAGGISGLVLVKPAGGSAQFPAYDGNGNVAALMDAANGNVAARYEYGPFGEPIRVTGAMAKVNPLCFSTKYTDTESGLLYYGYRYYSPATGGWLSPDPSGKEGVSICMASLGTMLSTASISSDLSGSSKGSADHGLSPMSLAATTTHGMLSRERCIWAPQTTRAGLRQLTPHQSQARDTRFQTPSTLILGKKKSWIRFHGPSSAFGGLWRRATGTRGSREVFWFCGMKEQLMLVY